MGKTLLSKINRIIKLEVDYLRSQTPYDTGNLRKHGVKLERISDYVWEIYVDASEAPYMPYTNEPWISPKWNGKKNPNEEWWNKTCVVVMENIARKLGTKLEREEIEDD